MRQIVLASVSSLAPKEASAASQDAEIGSQTKQHKIRPIMAIFVQTVGHFLCVFVLFSMAVVMEILNAVKYMPAFLVHPQLISAPNG